MVDLSQSVHDVTVGCPMTRLDRYLDWCAALEARGGLVGLVGRQLQHPEELAFGVTLVFVLIQVLSR